jgi:hypothetical protein
MVTLNEQNIRRAALVVTVKGILAKAGHDLSRRNNADGSVIFVVRNPTEAPGWESQVSLSPSVTSPADKLMVTGAGGANQVTVRTLGQELDRQRSVFLQKREKARADMAEAVRWQQRQETELAPLAPLAGLSFSIHTKGPRAGRYKVSLQDGHPLESLSLEQVKQLHTLLGRFAGS